MQQDIRQACKMVLKKEAMTPKLRVPRTIRPNFVCSLPGTSKFHYIQPLACKDLPSASFARLREVLHRSPRMVILKDTDRYLHAVCRTRLLRLPDDLKCALCPQACVIHISSASRYGIYDFGVNRARVERLRRKLQDG